MTVFLKYKKYFFLFFTVGFAVYFPILFNGFVWDDFPFILNNPDFHHMNIQAIFGESIFNYGLFYRPIPALYFATLYSLFGQQAFFYHIIQLSLHIINTALLFTCFLLFFPEAIVFSLALFFLVHPINIESVAFISSTTSQLHFLFGMSAFLLGVKRHSNVKSISTIFLLLLLSVLAKETGILFLFLILFYRYLFRLGKIKEFTFTGIGIFVVYFILRILVAGITFSAALVSIPIRELSLPERLTNIPAIIIYYLKTLIFPKDLSVLQVWVVSTINLREFFIPLLFCIILVTLLLYSIYVLHKNNTAHTDDKDMRMQKLLFFSGWYIIGMVLILQILPLEMTVADRWFYFPIVGLLGIIGVGLKSFQRFHRVYKKMCIIVVIIVISLFSSRTFVRVLDWKNNETLYGHDVYVEPENPILINEVARILYRDGKTDEAFIYANKSVFLYPNIENLTQLGMFYQDTGQYDNAISAYVRAIQMYNSLPDNNAPITLDVMPIARSHTSHMIPAADSRLSDTYASLAYTYYLADRPNDAIRLINEKGLKKFPSSARLYFLVAISEYRVHNKQKALEALDKSYQMVPTDNFRQQLQYIQYQINNDLPLNIK